MDKCNCKSCTMSKVGFDYICNKCHKPEFNITDDNFKTNEYEAEVKAENDEEARMENEELGNNGEEIDRREPLQDEETGVLI